MALSEEEQRLLDQLEASLRADDPKLAQKLASPAPRVVHQRRATLAGLGFVVGIVLLLIGLQTAWVVSVVGFVAMLASTVVALSSWQRATGPSSGSSRNKPQGDPPFVNKMEDRWRRRQQGGI